MLHEYFLGLDSGTQGTKALLLSRKTGKIAAAASAPHTLIQNNAGRREQQPAVWIKACETVIKSVLKKARVKSNELLAIGVSGQQHGLVPLDKEGQVIRPAKLWCDTETAAECEEITRQMGGQSRFIEALGTSLAVGYTASKVLWLKNHEPENYGRLAAILLPHDYINYWLTGEKKAECGDASGTGYFDIRNRLWSPAVLNAIDPSGKLSSCLPELISASSPCGTLRPALAEKWGLSYDVLVSSGGGDNMMAAIGTGNVAPGLITASLGTSGTIYAFAAQPVIDPAGELAAFCSSDGFWLPLVCTMNVTVSTELTRGLLGLELNAFNRKAAAAPPGSGGILLLPYFNGERTPALPHGHAAFSGLTSSNYTDANLCRAAMEGATFGLRYGLDVLKRNGIQTREIRLVGGGAKSPVWRQLVADVFQCPVVCPQTPEAGALGAALQAIWCRENARGAKTALEEITRQYISLDKNSRCAPQPKNVQTYEEIYLRYLALDQALRPFNER